MRLLSVVRRWDLETAGALVSSRMSEHRAATLLGVSSVALRQRITRLVARVEGQFPAFRFQRGKQADVVYGHEVDMMGVNGHG